MDHSVGLPSCLPSCLPACLLLAACQLAPLATLSAADAVPQANRPNIVLFVADDLGYGDLSCYGATTLSTPHIDALARQGVRLTDANATAAVCQPSRYSILTGAYTNRIQRRGNYQSYFQPGQQTIASMLKSAGYRTAAVGKWHNGFGHGAEPDYNRRNLVPDTPGAVAFTPLDIGFDSFFGPPRSHNEPPFVFLETAQDSQGRFLRVFKGDPGDPLVLQPHIADRKSRPFNDYGYGVSSGAAAAHQARPDTQIDLILAERVAGEIAGQKAGDAPFFYYVPLTAPHVPIGPSQTWVGRSKAGAYGDYIMQMDDCVGRITTALATNGLDRNTLVIVTSDNGGLVIGPAQAQNTETGAPLTVNGTAYPEMPWTNGRAAHMPPGPCQGQKTDAWEGGHRVPFIVSWPDGGIFADKTSAHLFSLTDILATVAAAAGAKIPDGAGRDSINQLPLLRDPVTQPALRTEMLILGTKSYMLRYTDLQGTKWAFIPTRGTGGETVQNSTKLIPWGQPYRNMGWSNSDIDTNSGVVKATAPARQLYNLSEDPGNQINVITANQILADTLTSRFNTVISTAPNRAPAVKQAIPPQTAVVGTPFALQLPAEPDRREGWSATNYQKAATFLYDGDGNALIYTVNGLPAGLFFAPFTRTISGTPTANGAVTVEIRAEDGRGGIVTTSFMLTITSP
jgi:arylsulfatase A